MSMKRIRSWTKKNIVDLRSSAVSTTVNTVDVFFSFLD